MTCFLSRRYNIFLNVGVCAGYLLITILQWYLSWRLNCLCAHNLAQSQNQCLVLKKLKTYISHRPLAVGVVMTCSSRHVGVHKCIAVIERMRFFTLLYTNAGSYSDMACTLHMYVLQICKLRWNRYLCSCTTMWKMLSLNHRNTFVYTNMATATRTYLESQWKYTELQVVYRCWYQ